MTFAETSVVNLKAQDHIMERIAQSKVIAYYRKGSFSSEIVWNNRKFVFPKPNSKVSSSMWIFNVVKKDVQAYLLTHKRIKTIKELPVNKWNENIRKSKSIRIAATDINHAYWRIAYLMKVISEKTYLKGLLIKEKSLRLAALANLSSNKEYQIIKDGEITDETVSLSFNAVTDAVYKNIRNTCYQHMITLSEMLGNDFYCYKTDCIYYKDTLKNKKLVQQYLEANDLEWKQLVEPKRPK